jgi:hypothetical protein
MAYTETYSTTDVAPATIDLLVSIFAGLVGFASLVAIVLLFNWIKGKKVKIL